MAPTRPPLPPPLAYLGSLASVTQVMAAMLRHYFTAPGFAPAAMGIGSNAGTPDLKSWHNGCRGALTMMPTQSQILLPILRALDRLGGSGAPRRVIQLVTEQFPQLTQEDLSRRTASGLLAWDVRVRWAFELLVSRGHARRPRRGIWAITAKGRQVLRDQTHENTPPGSGLTGKVERRQ